VHDAARDHACLSGRPGTVGNLEDLAHRLVFVIALSQLGFRVAGLNLVAVGDIGNLGLLADGDVVAVGEWLITAIARNRRPCIEALGECPEPVAYDELILFTNVPCPPRMRRRGSGRTASVGRMVWPGRSSALPDFAAWAGQPLRERAVPGAD
jgi:hypothetical protein